jgi:hypothetical protein
MKIYKSHLVLTLLQILLCFCIENLNVMAANHWFCPSKLFNIQFVKKIESQKNSGKRLFQDSKLVYNGISFGIFLLVCLLHYQYFLKSLASIICSVVFGNTTKPHSLLFSLSSLFLLCSSIFYFLFSSN